MIPLCNTSVKRSIGRISRKREGVFGLNRLWAEGQTRLQDIAQALILQVWSIKNLAYLSLKIKRPMYKLLLLPKKQEKTHDKQIR